ncbi:MAG: hypothetical protein NTZ05_14415, partial [Chloroflexi bacterium]|nr:hypothetical protein [Chloroflexota bacterium]
KNYGLYNDPEMDKLLEAQRREADPNKRKDLLKKIWDRQNEQLPHIWIPGARTIYAWRPYVKNHRTHGIMGDTNCYQTGNVIRQIWIDK